MYSYTTMKRIVLISAMMAIIISSIAAAQLNLDVDADFDIIVINSGDWEDVYSALLSARLIGKDAFFLRSSQEIDHLIAQIGERRSILLIEPAQNRIYNNLRAFLETRGHSVTTYDHRRSINFELFKDLDARRAIIIDPSYGYDSISVAPYALLTDSYVLFARADTIGQIADEIEDKAEHVILYGFVDRGVSDALSKAQVEIINKESKFENNIEIVKRFIAESDEQIRSVKFTNGEYIEKSLFTKNNPTVFIGNTRVPRQVEEFLGNSDIAAATLIGADLAPLASSLKNTLSVRYGKDLTVMALVGKSSAATHPSQIDPLDIFPITLYSPNISIDSIRYNQLLKQIELTIRNNNELNVFFLSSMEIFADGERYTFGDEDVEFIGRQRTKTLVYPAEITGEAISGTVSIDFGGFPADFERRLLYSFDSLPTIEVIDNSEIEILSITYDRVNKAFFVRVRNTGSVTAYVDLELEDVIIEGKRSMLTPNANVKIEPGKKAKIAIRAELSSLDLEENEKVMVNAYYGQRQEALFKVQKATLELKMGTHPFVYYAIIAVIVAIIVLLALGKKKRQIESGKDL